MAAVGIGCRNRSWRGRVGCGRGNCTGFDNDPLGDVSAVMVILPVLLAGVLFLTILIGSIYLTARIYRGLPGLDRKIQAVFYRIENGVRRAADQVVKPVYKANGWSASVKALRDILFRR